MSEEYARFGFYGDRELIVTRQVLSMWDAHFFIWIYVRNMDTERATTWPNTAGFGHLIKQVKKGIYFSCLPDVQGRFEAIQHFLL